MMRCSIACLLFVLCATALFADGPADNLMDKVRPVPPPGVEVPAADKTELALGVEQLAKEIAELPKALKGKPTLLELIPDVEIYHKAVHDALEYNEFYNVKEVAVARALLKQGLERAAALREGKSPWASATGLVVRGYVSKIDGSVQPYGLVVPASYQANTPGSVPARRLVPRPRRKPQRAELHQWPADVARRVHPGQRLCRASVWPVLQRQQVRRRNRSARGDRGHQEALPDRRGPPGRARLLDGRRRLLAVRRALSQPVGRRGSRRRLFGNGRLSEGFSE